MTAELLIAELGMDERVTDELAMDELATTELTPTELTTTELTAIALVTIELATVELVTTEFAAAEVTITELVATELAIAELGTTELVIAELAIDERLTAELVTELLTAELATVALLTTGMARGELTGALLEPPPPQLVINNINTNDRDPIFIFFIGLATFELWLLLWITHPNENKVNVKRNPTHFANFPQSRLLTFLRVEWHLLKLVIPAKAGIHWFGVQKQELD